MFQQTVPYISVTDRIVLPVGFSGLDCEPVRFLNRSTNFLPDQLVLKGKDERLFDRIFITSFETKNADKLSCLDKSSLFSFDYEDTCNFYRIEPIQILDGTYLAHKTKTNKFNINDQCSCFVAFRCDESPERISVSEDIFFDIQTELTLVSRDLICLPEGGLVGLDGFGQNFVENISLENLLGIESYGDIDQIRLHTTKIVKDSRFALLSFKPGALTRAAYFLLCGNPPVPLDNFFPVDPDSGVVPIIDDRNGGVFWGMQGEEWDFIPAYFDINGVSKQLSLMDEYIGHDVTLIGISSFASPNSEFGISRLFAVLENDRNSSVVAWDVDHRSEIEKPLEPKEITCGHHSVTDVFSSASDGAIIAEVQQFGIEPVEVSRMLLVPEQVI